MNPSEGRVPVSWDECADWLDAGQRATFPAHSGERMDFNGEVAAANLRKPATRVRNIDLADVRLLPPSGLVAAPSGMDGGGFLGAGADVPDGWEWRQDPASAQWFDHRYTPRNVFVQCRPPVKPAERAVVEVPLTQLVGRVIVGCDEPVFDWRHHVYNGIQWWAVDGKAREFPDGTLDLATGLVRVYAGGDA